MLYILSWVKGSVLTLKLLFVITLGWGNPSPTIEHIMNSNKDTTDHTYLILVTDLKFW